MLAIKNACSTLCNSQEKVMHLFAFMNVKGHIFYSWWGAQLSNQQAALQPRRQSFQISINRCISPQIKQINPSPFLLPKPLLFWLLKGLSVQPPQPPGAQVGGNQGIMDFIV